MASKTSNGVKHILGIDVGGTKIAAGLVDSRYKVTKLSLMPTSQTDLLGQLERLIRRYSNFDAIGLAVPGLVLKDGTVVTLPNIRAFKRVNLKKFLERQFHTAAHVMNDARAFALAEASLGAGKRFETVVGVVVGTGIGSGVIRHKMIYYGQNRLAGEIGHILVSNKTTLEQLMQKSGKFTNAKQAGPAIRMILSLILGSFDPEIVIFGGGRVNFPNMQKVLDQALRSAHRNPLKTKVVVGKLRHAGIIGAALPLLKK